MVLSLAVMMPAAADVQVDIGLNVPWVFGQISEESEIHDIKDFLFLVPDIKMNYFFLDQGVQVGAGIRMVPFIVLNGVYPVITAQYDISRIRLSGSIGGGIFGVFGLVSAVEYGNIWFPDASVTYKINDWLQAGVGATGVFGGVDAFEGSMPIIGYALARFSLGDRQ